MRQRYVRHHLRVNSSYTPSDVPARVLSCSLHVGRRTTSQGHALLCPIGELESATVAIFRQAVAEIGPGQRVIIDMGSVPFLDSCGIGALIGAVRRVRELHGAIAIAAVRKPVRRVLNLAGIDRIVELTETVEEAESFLESATGSTTNGDPIAI